jgi:hypothetical protein
MRIRWNRRGHVRARDDGSCAEEEEEEEGKKVKEEDEEEEKEGKGGGKERQGSGEVLKHMYHLNTSATRAAFSAPSSSAFSLSCIAACCNCSFNTFNSSVYCLLMSTDYAHVMRQFISEINRCASTSIILLYTVSATRFHAKMVNEPKKCT